MEFQSTIIRGGGARLGVMAGRLGAVRQRTTADGVLILGTNVLAAKVIDAIATCGDGRFHVIGSVDDSTDGSAVWGGPPSLGSLHQLAEILASTRPAHIVIAMADRRGRLPDKALLEARFRGVMIENAVDFFERLTGKLAIEALQPSSLILSNAFRHVDIGGSWFRRTLRRTASRLCAFVSLVLLAPLLVVIAVAIKLDSHGPIFFVQDRVGRGGKFFELIKFRTMRRHVGTRASEWVSDNAEQITRVGKWLRRFRLDELPQLMNVVRGEMNIVGPRPHPVSNHQLFLENIPYYGIRSIVRPGITGWAQVRYGYANNLEEETEKMRYDLYYIKHACFVFDMRILLETLRVLLVDRRSHEAAKGRGRNKRSSSGGRT